MMVFCRVCTNWSQIIDTKAFAVIAKRDAMFSLLWICRMITAKDATALPRAHGQLTLFSKLLLISIKLSS
jgi:hypothetical protein